MTEAPKILWYDDQECAAGPVQFSSYEVKYIRADLVDKLVDALEKIAGGWVCVDEAGLTARAALKA